MIDLYLIGFWLGPLNVTLSYAGMLVRNLPLRLLFFAAAAILIGLQVACGLAVLLSAG